MPDHLPIRPERTSLSAVRRLVLVALTLAALPASAHKLQVFAFADGARIEGSAYFAGGAKAQGGTIKVEGAEGRVLAELTPGPDGGFSYLAQSKVDHVIVADSGDGHRAEWRVTAAELAGGFHGSAGPPAEKNSATIGAAPDAAVPSSSDPLPISLPQSTVAPSAPVDLATIERAVARQVGPLREELRAAQDQARLHDIMGGIGYILGLVGIALWWRARCTARPR
jgi:nickel transport protein